jgi:hypothetical protein
VLELMLITNDRKAAIAAEAVGIDRIFVDLELKGKQERQGHLDTHITDHHIEDISVIKDTLGKSKLLVRINPFNEGTRKEVDECIHRGADIVMLPMFKTIYEVEKFVSYVNGRAKVNLLLETSQALVRIDQILKIDGIDEIHIGLNDLHLSLGLDFMFELLSEGIVEYLSGLINKRGIKFGFGGIARIGYGDLPSELIIGEHYRLGSKMAILSRAFRNSFGMNDQFQLNIGAEIKKIRDVESKFKNWTAEDFRANKLIVQNKVRNIVRGRLKK